MFFNVSRPSDITSKPWSYIKKEQIERVIHETQWKSVELMGNGLVYFDIHKTESQVHACFIFLISNSFLNWLDSSDCWKYSSSNRPSIFECTNMEFNIQVETNQPPQNRTKCNIQQNQLITWIKFDLCTRSWSCPASRLFGCSSTPIRYCLNPIRKCENQVITSCKLFWSKSFYLLWNWCPNLSWTQLNSPKEC